jgi:hypothetical protein
VTRHIHLIAWMSLAACGSAMASPPVVAGQAALPIGARVEASGFATIEQAPPSPFPDRLPPPDNRPKNETGFYAQMAGISGAEAQKRIAEQRATRPEFTRLMATLRAREAGNFTDARMIHKPDWAYVFYFKRNPEGSLAKYTRNPHFKAAQARYSREELQAIARPWVERFTGHRLLGGYGSDATYGEVRMDLVVSEAEFRALAEREGWQVPEPIKLEFSEAVEGPAMPEQVRRLIRIFPQSDRALGATNQALLGGRIFLRDGCLYVSGADQPERLAYFAREVAIGLDDQGYLALRNRGNESRHLGRIGEQFSWGGPIGIQEDMPMVAELRARCGNAPLEHVGVPQSARLFQVRPWVIDAIAERRKIGRDEAWRRFRKCIEDREARKPGALLDCDML